MDTLKQYTDGTDVSVHSGFPNAADDSRLQALNLHTLLILHPNSTFYFRITGDAWNQEGIFHDDIALIDRGIDLQAHDVVVWWHEDEFAISRAARLPKNANVWGVVIAIIHQYRRPAV
jgi:DNA polymerase V